MGRDAAIDPQTLACTCSPRRPPLPRQTLESKAHIPAKVTVRVPKDLFGTATKSGNHHLVQRTVLLESLEKKGPLTAGEALLKAGIKPRMPLLKRIAAGPEARRPFKAPVHFESDSGSSFPPKWVPS